MTSKNSLRLPPFVTRESDWRRVTIDALDLATVMPFWRAVLGYVDRDDGPEERIKQAWYLLSLAGESLAFRGRSGYGDGS